MSVLAPWTFALLVAVLAVLCLLVAKGLITPRSFAHALAGAALGAAVAAALAQGNSGHG